MKELSEVELIRQGELKVEEMGGLSLKERYILQSKADLYQQIYSKYQAALGLPSTAQLGTFERAYVERIVQELRLNVAIKIIEESNFQQEGKYLNVNLKDPQIKDAMKEYEVRVDQMISIMTMHYMRLRMMLYRDPEGRFTKPLTMEQILKLTSIAQNTGNTKMFSLFSEEELTAKLAEALKIDN